jgi:hypothetical protein
MIGGVRSFEVVHSDPASLARSAAVRSRAEQDPLTRDAAKAMTPADRLRAAFRVSRYAARLRRRA